MTRLEPPLRELAPASLPVDAATGPEALKSPDAVSKVPFTATVRVLLFAVNFTVPSIVATVPESAVTDALSIRT